MTAPFVPADMSLNFTLGTLDPRITFTRVGDVATRVNSSGLIETMLADTPRFDYDPMTLACKGLLIEEQRTNLILNSQTFGSSWTAAGATLSADSEQSPDGTLNADKFTATSSTAVVTQVRTKAAAPVTYTASLYMRGTSPSFALSLDDGGTANRGRISINLNDGTFTTQQDGAFTILGADVLSAGGGWYRAYLTVTTNSTTTIRFRNFFTVIGAEAILWGAQLEEGAAPTSYIATEASQVTRNPDVATMTGTNFSDWWQATLGAAFVQAMSSTIVGTRPMIQFDDGTADNLITLRGNAADPELFIVESTTPQAQLDAGTITPNTQYGFVGYWDTNDCAARFNSDPKVTDTSATIPTVTQARLGSDGVNYLNGHLLFVNYYEAVVLHRYIYTRRKNKAVFSII